MDEKEEFSPPGDAFLCELMDLMKKIDLEDKVLCQIFSPSTRLSGDEKELCEIPVPLRKVWIIYHQAVQQLIPVEEMLLSAKSGKITGMTAEEKTNLQEKYNKLFLKKRNLEWFFWIRLQAFVPGMLGQQHIEFRAGLKIVEVFKVGAETVEVHGPLSAHCRKQVSPIAFYTAPKK